MDVRDDSNIAALIDDIGRDEQESIEHDRKTAARFPESVEVYMDMPRVERMRMAAGMIKTYFPYASYEKFDVFAQYPPDKKSATGKVATDRPGIILNGAVAYDRNEEHRSVNTRPSMFVWAQAEDATTGSRSSFRQLGRLEFSHEFIRAKDNKNKEFGLDDWRAQEMIEIIDVVAANLINTIIHERNTQIGRQATQGAVQS